MKHGILETLTGALILALAGGYFLFMWLWVDPPRTAGAYTLQAKFLDAGGLEKGADVRIRGIKVGKVRKVTLDKDTFEAVVTLTMREEVELPADTVAAISGEGLSGDKYLHLKPGKEDEKLKNHDDFKKVEDYQSIEDQISRIIFLAATPGAETKDGN